MPRVKISIPACPVCNCEPLVEKLTSTDSTRVRCPNGHLVTDYSYREYEAKSKWKRLVKRKNEEMRVAHGIVS